MADTGRAPVAFGPEPPPYALKIGTEWGARGKGAWRTAIPVQHSVGWWWSGHWREAIEFVWWYSPDYVAGRLGYLAGDERMPPSEIERRWAHVAAAMKGRLVFLVQLAGAPKIDLLSGTIDEPAKLDGIKEVKFSLLVDGHTYSPEQAGPVRVEQFRDRVLLRRFPWYQFGPGGHLLLQETEEPRSAVPVMLGDYHIWLYRVEFGLDELLPAIESSDSFSLRILSRHKQRRADFNLIVPGRDDG